VTEALDPGLEYVVDPVTGEIVDPRTGEVLDCHPVVVHQPEYRYFDSSEWLRRAHHSAITFAVHDHGLYTIVAVHRAKNRALARKLADLQRSVRRAKPDERSLARLLQLIHRYVAILELPETVKETAAVIARKVFDAGIAPSAKREALAVASIVLAIKMHRLPIPTPIVFEKLELGDSDRKRVHRLVRRIVLELGIKPRTATVEQFIDAIASRLGLSMETRNLALRILDRLRRKVSLDGKCPQNVAAAIIYVAAIIMNEKRNQKAVAEAIGATEATIRGRYRDVVDNLTIEIHL